MLKFVIAAALAVSAAAPSLAAPPRDIARADPERRALLDALHRETDKAISQPNVFQVHKLRVQDDWAFAEVEPRTPKGAPIDISKTPMAAAERDGLLDSHIITALLAREAKGWKVKAWAIGPTDVPWAGWPEEFGAPHELIGLRKPE